MAGDSAAPTCETRVSGWPFGHAAIGQAGLSQLIPLALINPGSGVFPFPDAGSRIVLLSLAALNLGALAWALYLKRKVGAFSGIVRAALESTAEGILVVDRNGRMVSYNSKFVEMWSIPKWVLNSRDDAVAVAYVKNQLKNPEAFVARVRESYEARQAPYEDILELVDGRVFERHSQPLPASEQRCGRGWAFRDVTERRRSEQDLAHERNLLRTLIESLPDYIYVKDVQGRFLLSNTAIAKLMGFAQPLELIGKTDFDVFPEELASSFWADEQHVVTTGEPLVAKEEPSIDAAGNLKWTQTTKVPFYDESGRVIGLVGMGRDMTDRRHVAEQLQKSMEAAEAANRSKSEFLANMSHEIRTPMNGILGMTQIALETDLTAEQREYLALVRDSADSLLNVINDILDFSKIEAGKLEFDLIPFCLRDTLAGALRTVAIRAQEKALELMCEVADDVPDHLVGDPGRLRQVILNLVGNSIKFTDSGEIGLAVRLECQEANSVRLHFTVKDTGIGIAPEKQKIVFETFSQADGSTTRRYGGTGLGLSISRQLVGIMGGHIWLESEVGKGSTFHFTAELAVGAPAAMPIERPERLLDLRGMRVLIVDDNATNRRILQELLKDWGLEHTLAENGRTALQLLEEKAFDLMLLDIQMPDMDGFEVAREIQQRWPKSAMSIVVLTSIGHRGDAVRCRELNIDAYLSKPVQTSDLREVLERLGARMRDGSGRTGCELITRHTLGKPTQRPGLTQPLRILVAEDNRVNQTLARRLLEKEGHSVTIASDGIQAVEAAATGAFDLILMDVQMPEMNGVQAAAAIREQEAGRRRTPIVALTAHAMGRDRDQCIAAGMDAFISKPIQMNELLEAIHALSATNDMEALNSATVRV